MTDVERRLLEDAEAEVSASAARFIEEDMGSGIRPPPSVEMSESGVDTGTFGFEFGDTEAESEADSPCEPCQPC